MRRTLGLLLGGALIALAVVVPPASPVEPTARVEVDPPIGLTGVAFCPQWRSDAALTSNLVTIPLDSGVTAFTWWNGDTSTEELLGGRVRLVPSGLQQGIVPVMLEGDGRTAVSVAASGSIGRASSGCASWPANEWVVGVGSSLEGDRTTLVLMNPFPQTATVEVSIYSEQGLEVAESLEGLTVPAEGQVEVTLAQILRLRSNLVAVVSDPDGFVVPAMLTQREGQLGTAVGRPLAEQWYFPAGPPGAVTELVVVNPAAVPVSIDVDYFSEAGSELSAEQRTLERRSSAIIPTPDGASVQVRGDGELGVVMRVTTETGLGIATGASIPSSRWFLPGAGANEETATVSVVNPGPAAVTASYRIHGERGATQPVEFTVGPGAAYTLTVQARGALGVSIDADAPVIAGWWAESEELDLIFDLGVAE